MQCIQLHSTGEPLRIMSQEIHKLLHESASRAPLMFENTENVRRTNLKAAGEASETPRLSNLNAQRNQNQSRELRGPLRHKSAGVVTTHASL